MKSLKTTATVTLASILLLAACSVSQISVALAVVSDATAAAAIAIPVLEATGVISTQLGNSILTYTAAVGDAAAKSAAELRSTDTAAVQATKIIGYFENIAIPALGPTVGPEVQAIVKAIEAAVNLFLSHFKGPVAKKAIDSGAADRIKLSFGDRHQLARLEAALSQTAVHARSLMK